MDTDIRTMPWIDRVLYWYGVLREHRHFSRWESLRYAIWLAR